MKQQLRQMVTGGRLPHALLLLGPAGCGKLSLAIELAEFILCSDRRPEGACGQCSNCRKSSRLVHPDLHFSFPTVGANAVSDSFLANWRTAMTDNAFLDANEWLQLIGAENKQGNINKEECLSIIRKLSLKSFESDYKVLVLWLPEYLGKEGNRLLKLIEEPPEKTHFILVAENQELILNTILSRCQTVKVDALSDEEIIAGLLEKGLAGKAEAESVAYLANGDFNEARKLAASRENDDAALFIEWMRKCYQGNGVELVNWVEKFSKYGRENQKHFLRYALHFLREYMVLKLTGDSRIRLRDQELETAQKLVTVVEFDQLEALVGLFTDCSYFVERNANPKILFLDASIQVHNILKRKHVNIATAGNDVFGQQQHKS